VGELERSEQEGGVSPAFFRDSKRGAAGTGKFPVTAESDWDEDI